jgi:hypothetical protein
MERGSAEIEGRNLQVAGLVSDLLVAQANAPDPNGDWCFYAERRSMQRTHYRACGCHMIQSSISGARARRDVVDNCLTAIEKS